MRKVFAAMCITAVLAAVVGCGSDTTTPPAGGGTTPPASAPTDPEKK
jgi:hypothetical protein